MGIVFYNAKEDIGTERAGLFPVGQCPDLNIADASTWNNNRFYLGGDEVGHWIFVLPTTGDWSAALFPYSPANMADTYGKTYYFVSNFDICFSAKYQGYTPPPEYQYAESFDFGKMRQTDTESVIQAGISNTSVWSAAGYPPGLDGEPCGLLVFRCTCQIAGTPHSGFYFAWGHNREDTNANYFIPDWGMFFSENMFVASESDPQGGIPQPPEGGNGDRQLHGVTLDLGTADARNTAMGAGGIVSPTARGTHLYEIDTAAFSDFTNQIYGSTGGDGLSFNDIWQQFKNQQHDPLSGIIGALIVPLTPTASDIGYIRLSGQSFSVSGTCKAISSRLGQSITHTINLNKYYNSFLDYAPRTQISLYLPFIGQVSLNANECMGGGVQISYWVDFCTGDCVAYVTCYGKSGKPTYYNYSGNCAQFIPVSSYDGGISSFISGAAGMIGGLASGNYIGAALGAAEMIEPQTHTKHLGSFSGGAGCLGILNPFLVVNRPADAIPANFTNMLGGQSVQYGTVGSFSGYTEFERVRLDSVNATEEEKMEILSELQRGVIL